MHARVPWINMKFSFYGFHYPCLSLHFCMSRLVFRGNPLTEERERYTIKNRRSSQSPCRVPLIIHVDSKTRRQEGFELRASKKHFFFFFARRKFLTPINHDYLTEASPLGAVYFTYKVTRWITRALFSTLGCEGITFLNGSAMGLADTSLPLAVSLPW